MGWVTPVCHTFKKHLLSTYCVQLTMSLGYTVNNIGQCPCSHESYILERETDNNQIKKTSSCDESDRGNETGQCDGKWLQRGEEEQVDYCDHVNREDI